MEHRLHENIRAQRKERGLTQEQLAEAMGVSVGAVSKWELAQSMPEIPLLMALADFFDMSVDALLGYQLRSDDLQSTVQRIKDFRHNKQAREGRKAAEQAIRRYPNSFEVIYHSAILYFLYGLEARDKASLSRALALQQHAIRLIGQNTDPDISKLSLHIDIAQIHLMMGEDDQAVEQLKKHNPCGLNDAQIGFILSTRRPADGEAGKYLSKALINHVVTQIRLATGFANAFAHQKKYQDALDVLGWLGSTLSGLRKPGQSCFLDKVQASILAGKAQMYLLMGQKERARTSLTQARQMAEVFDAAPDYRASSMRFYSGSAASTYDDLGATAMEGIARMVAEDDSPELTALWQEVCNEEG